MRHEGTNKQTYDRIKDIFDKLLMAEKEEKLSSTSVHPRMSRRQSAVFPKEIKQCSLAIENPNQDLDVAPKKIRSEINNLHNRSKSSPSNLMRESKMRKPQDCSTIYKQLDDLKTLLAKQFKIKNRQRSRSAHITQQNTPIKLSRKLSTPALFFRKHQDKTSNCHTAPELPNFQKRKSA